MLPKKQRTPKATFEMVLKEGRPFFSPYLTLKLIKKTSEINQKSRFSFVVPKAVAKKAVDRNFLRRRGYAAISANRSGINNGFLCILFLKKEALKLEYADFKQEVENLLKKAKILN